MIDKFKFFCQKVLPTIYDDALSYYEVLNKMAVKLNEVIEGVNDANTKVERAIEMIQEFEDHIGKLFGQHTAEVQAALNEMRDEISNFEGDVDTKLKEFMIQVNTSIQNIVETKIDEMYYHGEFNNLIGLKKNIVFIGANASIKFFMTSQFDASYKSRGINIGYIEANTLTPISDTNSVAYKVDNNTAPTWLKNSESDMTPNNDFVTDIVVLIGADEYTFGHTRATRNELMDIFTTIQTAYPNAKIGVMPAFVNLVSYDILGDYFGYINSTNVSWYTGLIYLIASASYVDQGINEYKISANEPFLATMVEDVCTGNPIVKYRKRKISNYQIPIVGEVGVNGHTEIYFDGRNYVFAVNLDGDEPTIDLLNDENVTVFGDTIMDISNTYMPCIKRDNDAFVGMAYGRLQYGSKPDSNSTLLTLKINNVTLPQTNSVWVYKQELKFPAY